MCICSIMFTFHSIPECVACCMFARKYVGCFFVLLSHRHTFLHIASQIIRWSLDASASRISLFASVYGLQHVHRATPRKPRTRVSFFFVGRTSFASHVSIYCARGYDSIYGRVDVNSHFVCMSILLVVWAHTPQHNRLHKYLGGGVECVCVCVHFSSSRGFALGLCAGALRWVQRYEWRKMCPPDHKMWEQKSAAPQRSTIIVNILLVVCGWLLRVCFRDSRPRQSGTLIEIVQTT